MTVLLKQFAGPSCQSVCISNTYKGNIAYLKHVGTLLTSGFILISRCFYRKLDSLFLSMTLKTVATFVPDVCLKDLHG